MSNLDLNAQFPANKESDSKIGETWPTITDSVTGIKGSSSKQSLKTDTEKVEDITGLDSTKLGKHLEAACSDEQPSSQNKLSTQTYSAAVGTGHKEIDLVVTEENGEKIGLIPGNIATDVKPLWTELLVGKFPSKAPNLKQIFLTVNNIWTLGNRNIKIEVYSVSETLIKFRIQDKDTRDRVLRRGMWSIEGLPMILSKWAPIEELEALEVKVVPIWIIMKKVPKRVFHWKGLSHMAKVVGKPKRLHPDTIQCVKFDEAKILVEADLNGVLPSSHKFMFDSGEKFTVEFLYPWVPSRCHKCFQWGHNAELCQDSAVQETIHKGAQKEDEKAVEEVKGNENNLESGNGLTVQNASGSPSNSLEGRNIDGNLSKDVQKLLTESGLNKEKEPVITRSEGNKGIRGSGSFQMHSGKKVVTVEDALEELLSVKKGLRQVSTSPSSHIEKKNELQKETGSYWKQMKGSPIKILNRESPKEDQWKVVGSGRSSKGKDISGSHEQFKLPISPSRYDILAESNEEMEMMVAIENHSQDEEESETQGSDYEQQMEKALSGRAKAKNKKKEETKTGARGRGRGRKPKK